MWIILSFHKNKLITNSRLSPLFILCVGVYIILMYVVCKDFNYVFAYIITFPPLCLRLLDWVYVLTSMSSSCYQIKQLRLRLIILIFCACSQLGCVYFRFVYQRWFTSFHPFSSVQLKGSLKLTIFSHLYFIQIIFMNKSSNNQ